ncbi:MAG: GntR family transcriptional regulator, partial [Desulfobacterales bacterium]
MNDHNAFEGIMLPRSLMEDITDSLRDAIIEGRLQPGQPIVEKELQKTLGVSRAPIREALLKLEGQGLVVIVPRKGSFVRNITARFIQESFTIRAWLEGLAARISLEHLNESDYDHFDKILKDMAQLAGNKDFKGYFYRHWDFHNVFIKGSRNELLIEKV